MGFVGKHPRSPFRGEGRLFPGRAGFAASSPPNHSEWFEALEPQPSHDDSGAISEEFPRLGVRPGLLLPRQELSENHCQSPVTQLGMNGNPVLGVSAKTLRNCVLQHV